MLYRSVGNANSKEINWKNMYFFLITNIFKNETLRLLRPQLVQIFVPTQIQWLDSTRDIIVSI